MREVADTSENDASAPSAPIGGTPKEVTSFPLHARAGFMRVNIFERPDMDTPRLGYFRKGARTMVGDPQYTSESCPKGWFELEEGGFVCQGRGMLVGAKPRFIPNPPPPGNFDELDPYRHGFIRQDWTPSYKRMPTEESAIWTPPVKETEDGEPVDAGPDAEPEVLPHDKNNADGGVDYYHYTKRKFRNVKQLLERGFWVSVGRRDYDSNTHKYYYETVKGQWVPAENVHLIKPPRFKGYEVTGETPLPGAIVRDSRAKFFRYRNNRFIGAGPVERLLSFRVFETGGIHDPVTLFQATQNAAVEPMVNQVVGQGDKVRFTGVIAKPSPGNSNFIALHISWHSDEQSFRRGFKNRRRFATE